MVISCFSFTEVAQRAATLMRNGGALLTLTYGGSTRVMPNYNVMGVAKAALEASVRYLAVRLRAARHPRATRSRPGPVRTLAGAGIADARLMFNYQKAHAPLRRTVTIEEIGGSALYLLSDLSSGVTGEIHYVDSGYNIISMPRPEVLKAQDAAGVTGEEGAACRRDTPRRTGSGPNVVRPFHRPRRRGGVLLPRPRLRPRRPVRAGPRRGAGRGRLSRRLPPAEPDPPSARRRRSQPGFRARPRAPAAPTRRRLCRRSAASRCRSSSSSSSPSSR